MIAADYRQAQFSDHALGEMQRRAISKATVMEILLSPDSVREAREGRIVIQKTYIASDTQKPLLYRLFVDVDRTPPVIVTAYATSKIAKYEVIQ